MVLIIHKILPARKCGGFTEMKLTRDEDGRISYTRNKIARQWDDKMYLYPIPVTAKNVNPQLGQNEGWQWL